MIQITLEQTQEILHSMKWKLVKQDYTPTELEQNTIKYLQDEVNKISSNNCVSSSKNYEHIKAVTIQVHAEYDKGERKVVHGHTFSEGELTTLLAEKRGIADYINHLTEVLIYE